jgi:hypothetical protein
MSTPTDRETILSALHSRLSMLHTTALRVARYCPSVCRLTGC